MPTASCVLKASRPVGFCCCVVDPNIFYDAPSRNYKSGILRFTTFSVNVTPSGTQRVKLTLQPPVYNADNNDKVETTLTLAQFQNGYSFDTYMHRVAVNYGHVGPSSELQADGSQVGVILRCEALDTLSADTNIILSYNMTFIPIDVYNPIVASDIVKVVLPGTPYDIKSSEVVLNANLNQSLTLQLQKFATTNPNALSGMFETRYPNGTYMDQRALSLANGSEMMYLRRYSRVFAINNKKLDSWATKLTSDWKLATIETIPFDPDSKLTLTYRLLHS